MPKQPSLKDVSKSIFIPFIVIILLLLATFNFVTYLDNSSSKSAVLSDTSSLGDESAFWEKFLNDNPDYIPGWEEYARINYQLENFNEASLAIEEIKRIDPNYDINLEDFAD